MNPGMIKKNKKERKFSHDIDRILAGEKAEINNKADEDYRSNIDFMRKIIEYPQKPTASFQEGLKSRLLSKLAEKETAELKKHRGGASFGDWLGNLVNQRTTLRTAAVTAAVVVLALVAVWRIGLFSHTGQELVLPALGPSVAVEGRATTEKALYVVGDEINIRFTFMNTTGDTITFPFPPEIRIENMNIETVRLFAAGQQLKSLIPGESIQYNLTWDQKDNSGDQAPAGDYQVIMPNIPLGEAGGVVSLVESPLLTISKGP